MILTQQKHNKRYSLLGLHITPPLPVQESLQDLGYSSQMGCPNSGSLRSCTAEHFSSLALPTANKKLPTGKCLDGPRAVCCLPEDLFAIVGHTKTGTHCHLVGRAVTPSLCLPSVRTNPEKQNRSFGKHQVCHMDPSGKSQNSQVRKAWVCHPPAGQTY